MIVEASNLSRSGAGRLAVVADHLADCEEYTLDIVAHMKKVEVLVLWFRRCLFLGLVYNLKKYSSHLNT